MRHAHLHLIAFVAALNCRDHPAVVWRRTLRHLGDWSEQVHAGFCAPLRAIIATLLIFARSENAHTRKLSNGLNRVTTPTLYALFRWIGRLNYFS